MLMILIVVVVMILMMMVVVMVSVIDSESDSYSLVADGYNTMNVHHVINVCNVTILIKHGWD